MEQRFRDWIQPSFLGRSQPVQCLIHLVFSSRNWKHGLDVMITPLVRIPLATSGTHLSSSHLFLFLFFSPPYLLPPTTLSSSTGGDGAWWRPRLPPSLARGGGGRAVLVRAARRRRPCGPLALGPPAMARGRGARPSGHGARSAGAGRGGRAPPARDGGRSGAWRWSSTSTRRRPKQGVAAWLWVRAPPAHWHRSWSPRGSHSTRRERLRPPDFGGRVQPASHANIPLELTQPILNCIQTAVGMGPTQPSSLQPPTKHTVDFFYGYVPCMGTMSVPSLTIRPCLVRGRKVFGCYDRYHMRMSYEMFGY